MTLSRPGSLADDIRIEYNDDAIRIVEKINDALKSNNLILVDDNKEHDGFIILSLVHFQVRK